MIEGLSKKHKYRKGIDATENQIQRSIIKHMRQTKAQQNGWTFHSIPNGGKGQNQIHMYMMGQLSGVPDILIIGPNRTAMYMEIKRCDGKLSPYQHKFKAHCDAIGIPCETARSISDAVLILNSWGFGK